ncbi:MAG: hypothetical protein HUJ89_02895 [Bacteroidales bacterium]|nr:hypothetical protein [Bacteroidales bacterium]
MAAKNDRIKAYLSISNAKDLQYQRRLLESRIDHQELMISYKVKSLWDYVSPTRLLRDGCNALAARNKKFNIFVRTYEFVRSILS